MAGVAQLGEQQTEAWTVVVFYDGAFWRSRVQSTVLAFLPPLKSETRKTHGVKGIFLAGIRIRRASIARLRDNRRHLREVSRDD